MDCVRVFGLLAEVLREFASKRQVKLSRVTVRAKDEAEDVKQPASKSKHRRRRARASTVAAGGERKEKESSDRSLAKVKPGALHGRSSIFSLQPLIIPSG